jgi:hypothetical protein
VLVVEIAREPPVEQPATAVAQHRLDFSVVDDDVPSVFSDKTAAGRALAGVDSTVGA